MSDRPAPDEPYYLVLDEGFLQGGRREQSAEERLERLERIARENAEGGAWRSGPTVAVATVPRRRRHHLRTVLLVLSVTLGLLATASWAQGSLGDRGPAAPPWAGAPPAQALPAGGAGAPGTDPAAPVRRLAPPGPDPGGEGGYRFLQTHDDGTGRPVAYDPCRPITYVVRRAGEPRGGNAVLDAAVAELAAATGLVFQRGPDTDEAPGGDRQAVQPERYGPDFAPVLIAWSDEEESPELAGDVAGFGGSAGRGWDDASLRYVTGTVVLDREQATGMLSPFGGTGVLRPLVLHELGHLVGLAHVEDQKQIMFSESGDGQDHFATGDRRGLRLLGAGTCHTDWERLAAAP